MHTLQDVKRQETYFIVAVLVKIGINNVEKPVMLPCVVLLPQLIFPSLRK